MLHKYYSIKMNVYFYSSLMDVNNWKYLVSFLQDLQGSSITLWYLAKIGLQSLSNVLLFHHNDSEMSTIFN